MQILDTAEQQIQHWIRQLSSSSSRANQNRQAAPTQLGTQLGTQPQSMTGSTPISVISPSSSTHSTSRTSSVPTVRSQMTSAPSVDLRRTQPVSVSGTTVTTRGLGTMGPL